jgi:CheY-like chemotaxis protein
LEDSRRPVVLAVEDEPLILMLAVDLIRDAGFEPLWASNAEEAISILVSRDDIRIVFTDINMPGSMGWDQTCASSARSMAADQDHRDVWIQWGRAEAFARGQPIYPEAL